MRGFIAGVLVFIGLVLVPFATVGIWVRREILPTDAFTDLATEVVQDDAVSDALANRFLDELEKQEPRLALGRVVLEPATRQAIGTPQFEQIFRTAVGDMHAQLLRGDDELSLNLDALLPVVRDTVAQVNTSIANQIPTSAGLPAITVVRKDNVPQLWFGVEVTREASWVFPVLMLVAFASAVLIAEKRAIVLMISGFGMAFVCLVIGLALRTGRDFLSDYVGSVVDVRAFNAGYDIVTDSLVNQTLLLGLVGLAAGVAGVVWLLVARSKPSRPATQAVA
jgi:hypothetical protein